MGSLNLIDILQTEHDLVGETLMNTGVDGADVKSAYDYIFGANDLACELIRKLEKANGENCGTGLDERPVC